MKIHIKKETKFKNVVVSIRFRSLLDEETIAQKMLLSDILSNVCKQYANKMMVSEKLNDLYGASFSGNYATFGKSQIVEFRMKTIHSSYINENVDLLKESLSFLHAFVYEPLLDEDGNFDALVVDEAKRMTISKIMRIIDEPSQYCSSKAFASVGKSNPLEIQSIHQIERIRSIGVKELSDAYHKMLSEDELDIVIIGDVDEKQGGDAVVDSFIDNGVTLSFKSDYAIQVDSDIASFMCETRDISQAYITMVYQTNIKNSDADFYKLQVANAILGQTPSSLLFREVREKHSLCYSIHSFLLTYDGALAITVGVDPQNVEKTIALIKEQFTRVCEGDFSIETLDTAKEMLANSLVNQMDNQVGILNLLYRNILLEKEVSIEDMIRQIRSTSVAEVKEVFTQCEEALTFVLEEADHE